MKSTLALLALCGSALAAPAPRAACPDVHVFGARETTAPAGYGSAGTVVNLILNAHKGATAEAINYPAAGGNSYGASVQAGVKAVASQVQSYAKQCPNTKLVLVGYSQVRCLVFSIASPSAHSSGGGAQGSQIMDDAMCGGGDPNQGISSTAPAIPSSVGAKVKAMIWMGDPRHTPGAPYNVGSSTAAGVSFAQSPSMRETERWFTV